jgi:glutathione synthase/RimK-type ligase-like ATP-grasp enzyme
MIIGIQSNLKGFAIKWVEYCKENNIKYKLINVYHNDAVNQLYECDAFMWHYDHLSKKDYQVAKRLLTALEHSGKIVFPSILENWHYDDKIAQKYLLEAIDAPLIPSYVFYDKNEALKWADETTWPKVFKLTGGAGSSNVKLIKKKKQAIKLIKKSFSKGHNIFNQRKYFWEERMFKFRQNKSIAYFLKTLYHLTKPINKNQVNHIEKDYVYFQDFISNNFYDLRLVVINQERIFGLKRYNRPDDFRASGSGNMAFLKINDVEPSILKLVLDTTIKLKMNSIAYDIVFDSNKNPVIIEITFAYSTNAYEKCPGYWNKNLQWNEGEIGNYSGWMLEKVLQQTKLKNEYIKNHP